MHIHDWWCIFTTGDAYSRLVMHIHDWWCIFTTGDAYSRSVINFATGDAYSRSVINFATGEAYSRSVINFATGEAYSRSVINFATGEAYSRSVINFAIGDALSRSVIKFVIADGCSWSVMDFYDRWLSGVFENASMALAYRLWTTGLTACFPASKTQNFFKFASELSIPLASYFHPCLHKLNLDVLLVLFSIIMNVSLWHRVDLDFPCMHTALRTWKCYHRWLRSLVHVVSYSLQWCRSAFDGKSNQSILM